ncbi:MAG: hypothetical protein ABIK83_00350 [Candidatus Zixiibacteriota bacterium]
MISPFLIWTIAVYEVKLLLRDWSFRIFVLIGLFVEIVMNIGFATKAGQVPYPFHALAGSLPMMNLKLLNVYQGAIAAFLASDFIKRDRKHDSTQVVHTRSMTNADYIIGKSAGILAVFALLNALVLLIGFAFHVIFSDTPFAWQPYVYYALLLNLPTLIFMIGISSLLMNLIRSQAVVFVILLGFGVASLIYLGRHMFFVFDIFAFYLPVMYSDFVGLGNADSLLAIRGAYFLLGLALIGLSILFMKRLRQSNLVNIIVGTVSLAAFVAASVLGYNYISDNLENRDFRTLLKETSSAVTDIPIATTIDCSIKLDHNGRMIDAVADLVVVNHTGSDLDSLLIVLNPGLTVTSVASASNPCNFRRNEHLLWIKSSRRLIPGANDTISITYSGSIDERICYLDLDEERIEGIFSWFLFSVPKRYAFIENDFVLLTPETIWYPVTGLTDGLSYPKSATRDFVNFELDVRVRRDLTAISQGETTVDTTASDRSFSFRPDVPLQQVSLAVGRYESLSIEVDSTVYALHILPGHRYFDKYFDQIADSLPYLIREMRDDYELQIGLDYPYNRLDLVEVPTQFYCYDRLWTFSKETVQPQIVLLPELGTICAGTDFVRMQRRGTRRQESANLAESPQEIQAQYVTGFVRTDLLGIESDPRDFLEENGIEPRYHILPNIISHSIGLVSQRWPAINYALESYIFNRATPPQDTRWRSWSGLTSAEKANVVLRENSLADVITGDFDTDITSTVMKEKGRYLFALLEADVGSENFTTILSDFIRDHRFTNALTDSFIASIEDFSTINVPNLIQSWYSDTLLPGYIIRDVESYKVYDRERTRVQTKLSISNPQAVDGLVTLGFRLGNRRQSLVPWWRRGSQKYDAERSVVIPSNSRKEIGIVLDEPPSEMVIETYVSLNLPSIIQVHFGDRQLDKNAEPFDGEILTSLETAPQSDAGEMVVDNEDPGFMVLTLAEMNRFRNFLLTTFASADVEVEEYEGIRFWDLPRSWAATTDSRFYGEFVHSGVYKRTGDGGFRVSWSASIEEEGTYDVYFHNPNLEMPRWGRRGRGRVDKGEETFFVYHEDGVDKIVADLNASGEGWNLLGTFHLQVGENSVELTDRGDMNFVTADAVKWVRR